MIDATRESSATQPSVHRSCSRCPGAGCHDCPVRPELPPATPPTHAHAHRGLHWRWLLNGVWAMRERGNEWIVCEDAAGWRVTYYPFGAAKVEPWPGPDCGRTVWPTVEAAMDAVADQLTAGVLGMWI